jgi:hypothetical protein
MKSLISVIAYLLKDTFCRWFEQPGSPLSRFLITAVLGLVSVLILLSQQILEGVVRARLEKFGLNTMVVKRVVARSELEKLGLEANPERLSPLAEYGHVLNLRLLMVHGVDEWGTTYLAGTYRDVTEALAEQHLSDRHATVCFADELPPGVVIGVKVGDWSGPALVKPRSDTMRRLAIDRLLLLPRGWIPEIEELGHTDVTILQRAPGAPPLSRIRRAVNGVFALDDLSLPQIQSSEELVDEWDRLKSAQRVWRFALSLIMGGMIALVFGMIAALEFRQNVYVVALLRSFGAPTFLQVARQWAENAFLANLAIASIVGFAISFQPEISQAAEQLFGATQPVSIESLIDESLIVAACANIGVLLSCIPILSGLARPVGRII